MLAWVLILLMHTTNNQAGAVAIEMPSREVCEREAERFRKAVRSYDAREAYCVNRAP